MGKYGVTYVVCGFPATGKSYMYEIQNQLDAKIIDSDSSLFSWLYDEQGNKTNVRNPDFPNNYIEYIKEICRQGNTDIIFVSSHKTVRDALRRKGFVPLVVYPDISLKEEYIQRYKDRGNDESFIKMMDENWESFILDIEENESNKYKLKSGQYMIDVPIMNYKELGFHMVYQNDNMDNHIPRKDVTQCAMCRRKINNWQNYYTNNVRDLCCSCQIDISKLWCKHSDQYDRQDD
jgi:hypothetical protein